MTDRIACCIPECRRSFKRKGDEPGNYEIMCGRCWRTTDPRLRARYKALRARERLVLRLMRLKAIRNKRSFGIQVEALHALFDRACARNWAALKEDATIKSALGVEGTAGALAAHRRAA